MDACTVMVSTNPFAERVSSAVRPPVVRGVTGAAHTQTPGQQRTEQCNPLTSILLLLLVSRQSVFSFFPGCRAFLRAHCGVFREGRSASRSSFSSKLGFPPSGAGFSPSACVRALREERGNSSPHFPHFSRLSLGSGFLRVFRGADSMTGQLFVRGTLDARVSTAEALGAQPVNNMDNRHG